jgi:hypothetical protein
MKHALALTNLRPGPASAEQDAAVRAWCDAIMEIAETQAQGQLRGISEQRDEPERLIRGGADK